jgi:tetratricopeptide (TPR) repeat protein
MYDGLVTFDEAQLLQLDGRYSDLLRAAVREQVRAREGGDAADELEWTLWAAKACRYLGRVYEGMAHAAHAVSLARRALRPAILPDALYVQALLLKGSGQYDAALGVLTDALGLLPPDASDFKRAVLELDFAELCLDAGKAEDGRASLARAAARVQFIENTRLLAWTMYLRSHFEVGEVAAGMLVGAHKLTGSVGCPELEWQILWKLAKSQSRLGKRDSEEDCAIRALGILRGMASSVSADDAAAFWRQGARAEFVAYLSDRFPASLDRSVRAPSSAELEAQWDPACLPSFVHDGLQAAN